MGFKVRKLTQLDGRTRLTMAGGRLNIKKIVAPRDVLNSVKTEILHVAR